MNHAKPSLIVSVETGGWPTSDRIRLLELIGDIEAGHTGDQPASSVIPEEVEPSGWNQDAYYEVVKNLLRRHQVQVSVIFEAIKNGTGYVTREKVYELGNYQPERSLKGFTRPVNRFTADAVEAGLLPEDADDLLAPDYDPSVSGFQRAKGFRVPAEVVKMAQEWKAESEAKKNQR